MRMTASVKLPAKLMALSRKPVDPAVPGRIMGILEGSVAEQFRTHGSAAGTPWAPLSPNTVAARRQGKGRGGTKTLQDTGTLRQSVTSGGGKGSYRRSSITEVILGTRIPYAAVHQFGGRRAYTIKPKTGRFLRFVTAGGVVFTRSANHPPLPRRPFMAITPVARKRISGLVRASFVVGRFS